MEEEEEDTEERDHDDVEVQVTMPSNTGAYPCPNDSCVCVFQRLSSLEKHLSLGKCKQKLERLSLLDRAKIGYKEHLEEGAGVIPTLNPTLRAASGSHTVPKGWALKAKKKAYRFNDKQKNYLDAKFNIGQETGRKMDPNVVSVQMRKALDSNGKRLFNVNEFMSSQQIKSYFSRRAAKLRQQCEVTPEDINAAEEEANFCRARDSVHENIQLQHPIEFNQYNICQMSTEGSLGKMKVALLQEICENLEMNVPEKRVRLKAPYVDLLKEAVSKCTCQS
jgi:Arf-GAP/Rho-GAP domain/ANK repeat/PH domain-containing protein 3